MWTRKSVGCQCAHHLEHNKVISDLENTTLTKIHHDEINNSLSDSCACCVVGGCQCGALAPNRCTQCGLEEHCPYSTYDDKEGFVLSN